MKLLGLKNIRNIYGFTMRDLAQRINVSANLINLWERGDVDVPESRIDNLVEYLLIDEELLYKEEHNTKDLMMIEIARSNFKINEYRSKLHKESVEDVLGEISTTYFEANETKYLLESVKGLMEEVIHVFGAMSNEDYEEFDCIFNELLHDIIGERETWEKFKIIVYATALDEDMESWEDDYGLFCTKEQMLQKQIYDAVNQLYKIYKFKHGKYKPDWYEE